MHCVFCYCRIFPSAALVHHAGCEIVYRSGIYITCKEILPFSPTDAPAIKARLKIFHTRSLKKKNPNATAWLRKHCMQCFHWAAEKLQGVPLWSHEDIAAEGAEEEDLGALFNDFTGNAAAQLIDLEEIAGLQLSQDCSSIVDRAGRQPRDIVPADVIERALIQHEDDNPEEWAREENERYKVIINVACLVFLVNVVHK